MKEISNIDNIGKEENYMNKHSSKEVLQLFDIYYHYMKKGRSRCH